MHLTQVGLASGSSTLHQVAGDLHIYGSTHAPLRRTRIDWGILQETSDRLVRIDAYVSAQELSRREGVVVIVGDPRTGRRSGAYSLIVERQQNAWEFVADWDEPDVSRLVCEPNASYLLDLTGGETLSADIGARLLAHSADLAGSGARLFILATFEQWEPCRAATGRLAVRWEAPPASEVVLSVLNRHPDDEDRRRWLHRPELAEILASVRTPGDAVRLAEAIAEAPETEDALRWAIDRYQSWASYLTEFFERTSDGTHKSDQSRALLISTALLDGCPASTIFMARDRLLSRVKSRRPDSASLLAGPTLSGQVKEIQAQRDGEKISLARTRRGIDHAALAYVWDELPLVSRELPAWIEEITAPGAVAYKYQNKISNVLGELATRHGRWEIVQIARAWVESSPRRSPLLVDLLSRLSVDVEMGAATRKLLYTWVRQDLKPSVAAAIAEVCAGSFGQQYPAVALIRLRWLLRRSSDVVVIEACQRALRNISIDAASAESVLAEVVSWMKDERYQAAGSVALLGLLTLTGEPSTLVLTLLRESQQDLELLALLRDGWDVLLKSQLAEEARNELLRWLSASARLELPEEGVMSILKPVVQGEVGMHWLLQNVTSQDTGLSADMIVELLGLRDVGRDRHSVVEESS